MLSTGKVPIYIQLKKALISDIKSGKYPENSPLPAVNIIAENAGVSVRTAYLATQELIKDGICFKRPKKGTFVGNPANLVKHPVCLVWTTYNVSSPFEHPLSTIFYCGLLQGCSKYNITPVLLSDDPEAVIKRYERSREFDLKGVVVLDNDKFASAVELAKKFPGKKFFFVNYVMRNMNLLPPNMTAVVNDNYHGACRMMEHLISCGHRDFLLFSAQLAPEDRTYHNRILGALNALKAHAVTVDKKSMISLDKTSQEEKAFQAMTQLLRSGRRPQAVFCVNDLIAAGVSRALAAENITGIRVSGFDRLYPHLAEKWHFVTMQVPYSEMVMEALKGLVSPEKSHGKVIRLQPVIIK